MNNFREQPQSIKNQENKSFVTKLNYINYYKLNTYFLPFLYKKDGANELDEDKLSKLVDLSGLVTVREMAGNFDELPKMREEYFELKIEIRK